jgi:hypothetical protein
VLEIASRVHGGFGQILDVNRVYLVAIHIQRIGQLGVVWADGKSTDTAEWLALGEQILIEQNLLGIIE